ncbi:hypothetical protein ACFFYR_38135 [Paraburkholderia dipogonis]|uniref:hypothetical protein n=1 Tax=Paraburkholderia dipogonis TaxID=1211383 RepID=UPI0035E53A8E
MQRLLHLYGAHDFQFLALPHMANNLPVLETGPPLRCLDSGRPVFLQATSRFHAVWQHDREKALHSEDVQTLAEKYACARARESQTTRLVRVDPRRAAKFVISLRVQDDPNRLNLNDETFDEAACFEAIVKSNFRLRDRRFIASIKVVLAFPRWPLFRSVLEAADRVDAGPQFCHGHWRSNRPITSFMRLILTALYPQGVPGNSSKPASTFLAAKLRKLEMLGRALPGELSESLCACLCGTRASGGPRSRRHAPL